MDNINEYITFSYEFVDKDDGIMHEVRSSRRKDCVTTDEICEMFIDFMRSAGYSEDSVCNYFKQC